MRTSKALAGIAVALVVVTGGWSNVEHPDFPKWLCDALPPSFCAIPKPR